MPKVRLAPKKHDKNLWVPVGTRYILGALLVAQISSFLFLAGILYKRNALPYWFDNFVHHSIVHNVLGSKTYEPLDVGSGDMKMFDSRLTGLVDETRIKYEVSGYVKDIEIDGDTITKLALGKMDYDTIRLDGPFYVNDVVRKVCLGGSSCESVYELATIEDVVRGKLVTIQFEKDVSDEMWSISQLSIR